MNEMVLYKNRIIDYAKPVYLYRNLNYKFYARTCSIMQDGLIVAHTPKIMLKDCNFIIRKSGQLKVRLSKTKNVHAFIRGTIVNSDKGFTADSILEKRVSYNPYIDDYFKVSINNSYYSPVYCSDLAIINCIGIMINEILE